MTRHSSLTSKIHLETLKESFDSDPLGLFDFLAAPCPESNSVIQPAQESGV